MTNHTYKILALLIFISISFHAAAQDKKPVKSKERVESKKSAETKESKEPIVPKKPTKSKQPAVSREPLKSREIVTEFPCNPDATIFIESFLLGATIITTNENKVKLVTTVYYNGKRDISNEEWLRILSLRISGTMENVVVQNGIARSGPVAKTTRLLPVPGMINPYNTPPNSITVSDKMTTSIEIMNRTRRNIILYIPTGARPDIDTRFGDITVENNLKELKVRITNAGLTMKDAENLTLTSDYARIYVNNITDVKAEVKNGSFNAKNISTLNINSENSLIEITDLKQLTIKSDVDQYEIENAGIITGVKNYGDIRVTSLKTSFDITGKNANVKIRIIEPTAGLIKIDNQYAELRLPVGNLKNYTVNFEGGSTNTYVPFEKTNVTDNSFNAASGTGKPTSFNLKCNNCTVDFK